MVLRLLLQNQIQQDHFVKRLKCFSAANTPVQDAAFLLQHQLILQTPIIPPLVPCSEHSQNQA